MRRAYRGYHGLRISFDKHPDKHKFRDSQKLRSRRRLVALCRDGKSDCEGSGGVK